MRIQRSRRAAVSKEIGVRNPEQEPIEAQAPSSPPSDPASHASPTTPAELRARLDRLGESLNTVLEGFERLSSSSTDPSPRPSSLEEQPPMSSPVRTFAVAPSSRKAPMFKKFDGSRIRTREFLADMEIQTQGMKDADRIVEFYRFLEGPAYSWMNGKIQEQQRNGRPLPILHNWKLFIAEFTKYYTPFDRSLEAQRKILAINHDKSVAEFISEFDQVRGLLDWNDAAICSRVLEKLHPEYVDQLILYFDRFDHQDYSQLVEYILHVGSNLQHKKLLGPTPTKEKVFESSNNHQQSGEFQRRGKRPRSPEPARNQQKGRPLSLQSRITSPTPASKSSNGKYSRGKLSRAEKARRYREGLCAYCASPDHKRDNCPERKDRQNTQALASLSFDSNPPKNFRSQ